MSAQKMMKVFVNQDYYSDKKGKQKLLKIMLLKKDRSDLYFLSLLVILENNYSVKRGITVTSKSTSISDLIFDEFNSKRKKRTNLPVFSIRPRLNNFNSYFEVTQSGKDGSIAKDAYFEFSGNNHMQNNLPIFTSNIVQDEVFTPSLCRSKVKDAVYNGKKRNEDQARFC